MKNGKVPGVDDVTAEAIKAGGDILFYRLHTLFQSIRLIEYVPSTWKKAFIIPIRKKRDSQDCKNYRDISLLSIIGKVFMKVIQVGLQKNREQTSREEETGFRPHRG